MHLMRKCRKNNFFGIFNHLYRLYKMMFQPEIVKKGWGKEVVICNNKLYCAKILCFEKAKKCSMHYHILKDETWYVVKGSFILRTQDTSTGLMKPDILLNKGDIINIPQTLPHQLEALEDSEIFEVSTTHFDEDSYRTQKGD